MRKIVPAPPTRLSMVPARLGTQAAMMAAGVAGHMFFLLRMAFWLGLVLVLLPIGAAQRSPSGGEVSATEAISAASATVGDLRGFCERQPEACTVGSQVATAIGYRAQAGAKMLYEALSEAMAPRETGVGKAHRGTGLAKSPDARRSRACLARAGAAQGRQALRVNRPAATA